YDPDRFITQDNNGNTYLEPRWDGKQYKVKGYRNASGDPVIPFTANAAANTNEAIFPNELQEPSSFTQKGIIKGWDYYPEYCEGDFLDLKDLNHGSGPVDNYSISKTLETLANIYKFWITLTDCDGFRIDTVKHMDKGATRYFASVIHEFGQTIGKEKFLLIGEITGGRENAFDTLEATGLDAALGIDDIPDKMEYLVKGYREPVWYFDLFRNSILVNKDSHAWFRNKVVTMFDDHDGVSDGKWKARFCAKERGDKVVLNALALNALSLGIPCIYYGSEQYFNGHATEERDGNDIFLRESMFGGKFGSFQSSGYHFFDESSPAYAEFAKILKLRSQQIALRRGRQYLREISGDGMGFGLPHMMGTEIRSVVPWSRIIDQQEIVVAINTDYDNARTAWVTVDSGINEIGKNFTCLYSTDCAMINYQVPVEAKNGRAIKLTVPAAGCVIYE
ncbi:MAG: alpha-amylase family glycosyl hydrolase, partial [Bacteroidota bacterium]|nr:alpha-amylase family glycosyl hydrolase [Bacteroidota bacterium]